MTTKAQIQSLIVERIQEIEKELLKKDLAKTNDQRYYFTMLELTLETNQHVLTCFK